MRALSQYNHPRIGTLPPQPICERSPVTLLVNADQTIVPCNRNLECQRY